LKGGTASASTLQQFGMIVTNLCTDAMHRVCTSVVLCLIPLFLCGKSFAQETDTTSTPSPKIKFSDIVQIHGYVKNLNIVSISENPLIGNSTENFLHNRINLKITPGKGFLIGAELRTRLFYAGRTATTQTLHENYEVDGGLVDMTANIGRSDAVLLNTTLDRLYLGWGNQKVDVRVGRQRINWGVNLAWNPNDIFNAYNFIDFDYEERPGTDAMRFQYFGKNMSGFEIAVAPREKWLESTAAVMYKMNVKGYDLQFIAGQYRDEVTAGIGWAGNLGNAGFKGEAQWFAPFEGFADSTHTVSGAVSVDYAFKNSLYLNGSLLFNSNGIDDSEPAKLAPFFSGTALSAKNLMPTRYNGFISASYPITPLINSSLAVIYGYGPHLLLINPSLTYSVSNSFDILLVAQLFFSEFPEITPTGISSSYKNLSNSVFLRVKWSY
jgi:hypothetical protein